MIRPALFVMCACLAVGACGRGDSSLNPMRWFGGGQTQRGPATLEPKGGYADTTTRSAVPQVLSARWEPLVEGRLLVVEGIGPTQGWWDVALVTESAMPEGRLRPDPDGVLRLRLVGQPPRPDSPEARRPARRGPDTISTGLAISHAALNRIDSVVISGAGNAVTLRR